MAQVSSGVALLIVARGLARRLWRAWLVALVLFSLGAIFALAKGLAWEEALMLTLMAGTLLLFRDSFYRKPLDERFTLTWGWLASIGTTAFAILWLGFFAYRHVEYANELWWQFAWDAQASRFPSRLSAGSDASGGFDDQHSHQRGWSR